MYTVAEAAEATGTSKSTILRAIKRKGGKRLSAEKDDEGQWKIDPAELHRVYPIAQSGDALRDAGGVHHSAVHDAPRTTSDAVYEAVEIRVLQVELNAAETLAADREKTIDHLRSELEDKKQEVEDEKQERRQVQTKLSALLTDQRPTDPVKSTPTNKAPNYVMWAVVVALFGLVIWLMLGQGGVV